MASTDAPLFLKDVTLAGVDGVDVERLVFAAKVCLHYCTFEDVKLFGAGASDAPHVCRIDYTDIDGYAQFILQQLHKHIATSHVLLIQHDGFVLNPAAWTNEFLDYDYVGAPLWFSDGFNVGNGAFSLRSKRLLECTSRLLNGPPWNPEDLLISRVYRRQLEDTGMKFAPVELARKFSMDGNGNGERVWDGQFGFHNFRTTDLSRWTPPTLLDIDQRIAVKQLWASILTSTRHASESRRTIRRLMREQRRLVRDLSALQSFLRDLVLEEGSRAAGFASGIEDMTPREMEDLAVEVFSSPRLIRALGIRYGRTRLGGEPATVDCAARRPVCHGVCCTLNFALSRQESQNPVYRLNVHKPFELLRRRMGICVHWRPEGCSIYEQRPGVCSRYSCTGDKRIWADFDRMVPGPLTIRWARECADKGASGTTDSVEYSDNADGSPCVP